jgi:hypothetical protein
MVILAPRRPKQLERRTAQFLHQEIAKITRGSHYEWASAAIGREIDSLCQVYTDEMVPLISAINVALNPTQLETTPAEPKELEGWELVQQYNTDPSSLSPAQISAACSYFIDA